MSQRGVRLRLAAALIGVAAAMTAEGAIYTVRNTRNGGGNSLRTAINNANGVPGSTIQFAIPTTDTNYNPATGVFTITLTTALPAITAAGTILDATTQTAAIGDTNPGVLGAGGTVGVDAIVLPTVQRPEILIADGAGLAVGIDVQASNVVVRGLAIYGFGNAPNNDGSADIRVGGAASGVLLEQNVIGSTPVAFVDPGAGARSGGDHIRVTGGDNGTVRNNLIGFAPGKGMELNNGSNGWLVESNEFRRNGIGNPNLDAIDVENASGGATVRWNLMVQSEACGIDSYMSSGGNNFVNNTAQGNGIGAGASLETPGIRLYGAGTTVDRNISSGNVGPGVGVTSNSSGNTITRNSIFGNGIVNGQIGIDLFSATDNQSLGTAPYVTQNDSGDVDNGGNGLVNFPVLVTASVGGGQLTLAGFARPGSSVEVFLAAPDPSGFGEGQTYLFTAVEGSLQDGDAGTGTYTNPVNGLNQGTDTTNRFLFAVATPPGVAAGSVLTATATVGGATSEFSGIVTVVGEPLLTLVKSVNPGGNQPPGTDLAYSVVFANTGSAPAYTIRVLDGIPANSDFLVASTFFNAGSSGLTALTEYSDDGGSDWTYTPVSGAGGAPPGYDRVVTDIRWSFTGTLSDLPPANQATVGFTVRIR